MNDTDHGEDAGAGMTAGMRRAITDVIAEHDYRKLTHNETAERIMDVIKARRAHPAPASAAIVHRTDSAAKGPIAVATMPASFSAADALRLIAAGSRPGTAEDDDGHGQPDDVYFTAEDMQEIARAALSGQPASADKKEQGGEAERLRALLEEARSVLVLFDHDDVQPVVDKIVAALASPKPSAPLQREDAPPYDPNHHYPTEAENRAWDTGYAQGRNSVIDELASPKPDETALVTGNDAVQPVASAIREWLRSKHLHAFGWNEIEDLARTTVAAAKNWKKPAPAEFPKLDPTRLMENVGAAAVPEGAYDLVKATADACRGMDDRTRDKAVAAINAVPEGAGDGEAVAKAIGYMEHRRACPWMQDGDACTCGMLDARAALAAAKGTMGHLQRMGATADSLPVDEAASADMDRVVAEHWRKARGAGGGAGWIACSERMPEEYRTVIVDGGIATWQGGSLWLSQMPGSVDREIQWPVTRWMPLPEGPKA